MKKLIFLGLFILSICTTSNAQTDEQRATAKTAVEQWTNYYGLTARQRVKAEDVQLLRLSNIAEVEAAAVTGQMSEELRLRKMVSINEGAIGSMARSFDEKQMALYSSKRQALRKALNDEETSLRKSKTSAAMIQIRQLQLKQAFVW